MTAQPAVGGLDEAMAAILVARGRIEPARSALVGISGIDGSGKGYLAARLAEILAGRGQRVATINVDGWLNLPARRFSPVEPARHFYEHAIRFDEMFDQLVLPLRARRTHAVVADFAEETATAYRPHTYRFEDVGVILLEGIFLFKRAYRRHLDLALWLDCSFETALERALSRGQEGLPPDETIRAYETIYFPAQRIHFARDEPRGGADLVVPNDHRLTLAAPSAGGPPPSAAGGASAPAPGGA
jgi:uridine kinase